MKGLHKLHPMTWTVSNLCSASLLPITLPVAAVRVLIVLTKLWRCQCAASELESRFSLIYSLFLVDVSACTPQLRLLPIFKSQYMSDRCSWPFFCSVERLFSGVIYIFFEGLYTSGRLYAWILLYADVRIVTGKSLLVLVLPIINDEVNRNSRAYFEAFDGCGVQFGTSISQWIPGLSPGTKIVLWVNLKLTAEFIVLGGSCFHFTYRSHFPSSIVRDS